MPNILFASNSVSHFPGTEARNDAWSYDANRVPYSIYTPPATMASTPLFDATTTNETWFHFRCGSGTYWLNNAEPIFEIVDIDGDRIGYMDVRDNVAYGYTMNFVAGAQVSTQTKWFPVLDSQMRTYDIRILYSGVLARMEAYVNEVLIHSAEFTVSEARVPRYLRIGGHRGASDEEI